MSDDFQQTVDLKLKKEQKQKPRVAPREAFANAKEIDEVYQEKEGAPKKDLKKIEKYQEPQVNEGVLKKVLIFLIFVVVALVVYFMIFSGNKTEEKQVLNWYAIKLITGEIYYGEINDTKSDPVVIENVYYNYDQIKEGEIDKNYIAGENTNLRLVKRGNETHGPAGSMNVVRAQVVYMEPLKEDSKVLKAIMNYEK